MKRRTEWTTVALLSGMLVATGATAGNGANTGGNKPVSDTYITSRVKVALAKDSDTKAKNIHVKTTNGVVSLSGTARSEVEKEKAEQDARAVRGVTDYPITPPTE
jgi:hyperosmotically inducible protein